jgi:hypothetical protein
VVHESFQLLGSLAIVVGGSAIFYNKVSHSGQRKKKNPHRILYGIPKR